MRRRPVRHHAAHVADGPGICGSLHMPALKTDIADGGVDALARHGGRQFQEFLAARDQVITPDPAHRHAPCTRECRDRILRLMRRQIIDVPEIAAQAHGGENGGIVAVPISGLMQKLARARQLGRHAGIENVPECPAVRRVQQIALGQIEPGAAQDSHPELWRQEHETRLA